MRLPVPAGSSCIEFTTIEARVAKGRVEGCFLRAGMLAALCLLTAGTRVIASSSSEEALRTRVEQFYSAVQQGDKRQIERYLTKDSKPLFRNQPMKPVQGYQIQSIQLEPDGKAASVVVQVPYSTPTSPRPFPTPRITRWRLINRVWYLELAKPDPHAQQALFGVPPTKAQPPSSPDASKDLKFESVWCGLGEVQDGQHKVAWFTFTNVSTHLVTLAALQGGGDYLRLKTQQKEYKPGESGTLEFEFDPSSLGVKTKEAFTQDVIVKTEPGGAYYRLTVSALVTPAPAHPAQP